MSRVDMLAWFGHVLAGVTDEIRHSLRVIVKGPFISAMIVLLLAFGIGLNVTVFSFLEATVTNPFPFPDAERLVDVVRGSHERGGGPFNHAAFTALRDNNEVFSGVAGYRDGGYGVSINGVAAMSGAPAVRGAAVTANVFEVLGVQPLLGRVFTSDEEGPAGDPVAIISHHRWQIWFDGRPGVLGEVISVDGVERTIVGVMPRGFKFYEANAVWIPLPVDGAAPSNDTYRFSVVGRLRPEVTMPQAHTALAAVDEALKPLVEPRSEYEETRQMYPIRPARLAEGLMIPGRVLIGMFFQLAGGIVMVVLGANLASLLFARGVARRREIAVRRALGAPRGRLIRQVLVENLMLAVAGGACGLLAALWGHRFFIAIFPLLAGAGLRLDMRILTFAIGVATLAVLVFGSKPLLELSRTPPESVLKEWSAGLTASRGARNWQNRLVILQVALSFFLLVGAALVARSIIAITGVEPGFDAAGVFEIHLSDKGEREPGFLVEATGRVAGALETMPGIAAVSWRGSAPEVVIGTTASILRDHIETREGPSDLRAQFRFTRGPAVPGGFFDAFGLSLLRGRLFDARDVRGAPLVAVLSEEAARILWPDQQAVGQDIRWSGGETWVNVIGVVTNIREVTRDPGGASGMSLDPAADIYLAAAQFDNRPSTNVLWVRPARDPEGFPQFFHSLLAEIEPGLNVGLIRTVWDSEYGRFREEYGSAAQMLGALGMIVLLLSVLGTYSVVAYTWAQREREVGLRMACGASPRDVLGLVQSECRKLALKGVLVGAILALVAYRFLAWLFFEIGPWDPISYVGIALLLIGVAALAGLSPSLRAMRTDPMEALRRM